MPFFICQKVKISFKKLPKSLNLPICAILKWGPFCKEFSTKSCKDWCLWLFARFRDDMYALHIRDCILFCKYCQHIAEHARLHTVIYTMYMSAFCCVLPITEKYISVCVELCYSRISK